MNFNPFEIRKNKRIPTHYSKLRSLELTKLNHVWRCVTVGCEQFRISNPCFGYSTTGIQKAL